MDDKSGPEKRCESYCNTGSSILYFGTTVAFATDGIKLLVKSVCEKAPEIPVQDPPPVYQALSTRHDLST